MISQKNPFHFQVMVKPFGPICNLDCKYCYYLKKNSIYADSSFRMNEQILKKFTDQYIKAHTSSEITFDWQGGEPTLIGLEFFQKAIQIQNKYKAKGFKILNTIQTNGTLLNDEWCLFFKKNNFLIGISLDGPEKLHDKFRKDKEGRPSFNRVMVGVQLLRKHQVDHNILTTVNAGNVNYPLEVYSFLTDQVGAKYIQFIPIVERSNRSGVQRGLEVTKQSVPRRAYGEFLISIFDTWIRKDVGSIFVQLFDVALGIWYGLPSSLCIFSKTCGTNLALEHNGDLFACDHYVEPNYFLGNIIKDDIDKLANSEKQFRFSQEKLLTLPEYCKKCEYCFICNGECPKNRFIRTPDHEEGLNYLCESYKAFFSHIDKPMKVMASYLKKERHQPR